MLSVIIDFEILIDFIKKQPEPVLNGGDPEVHEVWTKIFKFLKKGCNLYIYNYKKSIYDNIFNLLTERGSTSKIKLYEKSFILNTNIYNLFSIYWNHIFLVNNCCELIKKSIYPIIVTDKSQYFYTLKKLTLHENDKIISINNNVSYKVTINWDFIDPYLQIPYTDIVLIDSYILENFEYTDKNIKNIIKKINFFAKIKVNFLLITYNNKKSPEECESLYVELKNFIKKSKLKKINFGIVFLNSKDKLHDRSFLFNYIRIKSGDSFVYFYNNGKLRTKGTEIEFNSLIDDEIASNYEIQREMISKKINNLYDQNALLYFGNIKNNILGNI